MIREPRRWLDPLESDNIGSLVVAVWYSRIVLVSAHFAGTWKSSPRMDNSVVVPVAPALSRDSSGTK
jgi:hypothetical protein